MAISNTTLYRNVNSIKKVTRFLITLIVLLSFDPGKAKTDADIILEDLHLDNQSNLAFELPSFKLPYCEADSNPENTNCVSGVFWTGGPHAYNESNLAGTYPPGQGSGLDFANKGTSFPVLAMASGKIIEASCTGYGSLGCIVAIKHNIGGTVLIYAHLNQNSVKPLIDLFEKYKSKKTPFDVPQGSVLGKVIPGAKQMSTSILNCVMEWTLALSNNLKIVVYRMILGEILLGGMIL